MLDVDGVGFIAYVLGKVLNFLGRFVGLYPTPGLLTLLGQLILALIVVLLVLTIVPGFVWGMRKIMADIQSRHGPTRVGPFGLLQTLADGVKMIFKEDVIPARADRLTFILAPYLAIVPVLLAFAPLPWSGGVILGNVGAGILFILAIGAISPLGEVYAGWGSNNKYGLVGGLRAAAMDVSYEIPMVISALAVVMLAGTLNTQGIVAAQQPFWFFLLQPLGVGIFFASAIAKIGVVPIDLPEAESELVAGYFTEYSGIRFGVFMLTVFANIFLMAAITVTLFFGGWSLLPPWALAIVMLFFLGILLTRQPTTTVNIGPPALAASAAGVIVTFLLAPKLGLGNWLLTTAWNADVANHFLGPAATPGNFVQTFVQAWEFLVPAAIIAAIVNWVLVLAEKGTPRDARIFPAICLSSIALPWMVVLPLVPFLYAGTSQGVVHFFGAGLQTLLVPWTMTLDVVGLLFLTALLLGIAMLVAAPFAARMLKAAGVGLAVVGLVALALAAFVLWPRNPHIDLTALVQLTVLLGLPALPTIALLAWDSEPRIGATLLALGLAVPALLLWMGILPASPFIVLAWLLTGVVAAAVTLLSSMDDMVLAGALTLLPALIPMALIPIGSFLLKSLFFSFLVFWLWFTLPRVRVDQFLRIGWKTMFPLSLVTLVMAGVEAWWLRGGGL
jgi:NADH-quinone oxidoreductase subunit H